RLNVLASLSSPCHYCYSSFFFNDPATTDIYSLSLHDALPIALMLFLLGLPFWLMPQLVLQIFTQDPELLALGQWPLRITGLGMTLDATALVLTQALLGAGASRMVMGVNLGSQWLIFLPCAYLIGPVLGGGLLAVWLLQSLYRVMASVIFAILWRRKHWADIRL